MWNRMKTSWTCFTPLKALLVKVTTALFFSLSSIAFAQDSANPLGRLIFEASVPGTTSGAATKGTLQNNYSSAAIDSLPGKLQTQDFTSRSVEEYRDAISKSTDEGDLYIQTLSEQYEALGDIHFSFDRSSRAFDAYSKAYDILVRSGKNQEEAAKLITPRPDVAVPEFGTHYYSRDYFNISPAADIPYKGYIDVVFSKKVLGILKSD